MSLRKPTYEEAQRVCSKRDNLIGSGSYRKAYREPGSPWVFKKVFEKYLVGGSCSNTDEYQAYLKYRETKNTLPEKLRMPQMYLLECPNGTERILAVRYVPESRKLPDCDKWDNICVCTEEDIQRWGQCWSSVFSGYSYDAHRDNVRHYRGALWLIDAQDFLDDTYW